MDGEGDPDVLVHELVFMLKNGILALGDMVGKCPLPAFENDGDNFQFSIFLSWRAQKNIFLGAGNHVPPWKFLMTPVNSGFTLRHYAESTSASPSWHTPMTRPRRHQDPSKTG